MILFAVIGFPKLMRLSITVPRLNRFFVLNASKYNNASEVNKMNRLMSVSQVMLFTKSSKLSLKSLLTIMNPIFLYPFLSSFGQPKFNLEVQHPGVVF